MTGRQAILGAGTDLWMDLSTPPESFIEDSDQPGITATLTELTFDLLMSGAFKAEVPPHASIMDIGTPLGWVRCYGDGRSPEFHEDGSDATEAAREWFEAKGF